MEQEQETERTNEACDGLVVGVFGLLHSISFTTFKQGLHHTINVDIDYFANGRGKSILLTGEW